MPKKYHIHPKAAPLGFDYLRKFKIVRGENCINCGKCTKVCIYEAHKRRSDDRRRMAEPNTVVCRNCFRCIQECPRGALEKSLDRDFVDIGGAYWKPDMLLSLWKQAEDGKVPVSGAGYRGPFSGSGFDSMWTDMSEIVRPTRDGIHGREYINTSVDLGRRLNHLSFDSGGRLTSAVPDTVDIPIPVLFEMPAQKLSANVVEALVRAAADIITFTVIPAAGITPEIGRYGGNIIPLLEAADVDKYKALLSKARLVSIKYGDGVSKDYRALRERIAKLSAAPVIIRVPAEKNVEDVVLKLAQDGAEIVHIAADYRGRGLNGSAGAEGRHLKDIIRSVHQRLVQERIRDEVVIVASGGIAMAEHVVKAMLCGADLTAVDLPLMIALGARLYEEPEMRLALPEGLGKVPVATMAQRMVNLMGAWHSQILEMMGAMGIREARRLRGESGRAIFFEEIDRDTFGDIFRKKKAARA